MFVRVSLQYMFFCCFLLCFLLLLKKPTWKPIRFFFSNPISKIGCNLSFIKCLMILRFKMKAFRINFVYNKIVFQMLEDVKKKWRQNYLPFRFEGREVWNKLEEFRVCCRNQACGRNSDLKKCKKNTRYRIRYVVIMCPFTFFSKHVVWFYIFMSMFGVVETPALQLIT